MIEIDKIKLLAFLITLGIWNQNAEGMKRPFVEDETVGYDRYIQMMRTLERKGIEYTREDREKYGNEIPYGIRSLGDACFASCTLSSITIPSSVSSLGRSCFIACSNLSTITIPSSVSSIGNCCFYGCSNLSAISLPPNIKTVENNCFEECIKLSEITIPNSVSSIGKWCFYECSSLSSITIPTSVTSLGYGCFRDCNSLKTLTIPQKFTDVEEIKRLSIQNGCKINIIEDVYTKEDREKYGNKIPDGITALGDNCFRGTWWTLTSITIPNSVTSIGNNCFDGCMSLRSIDISTSVVSIGTEAFRACVDLTGLKIPNNVTFIGSNCFWNCRSLSSITLPEKFTSEKEINRLSISNYHNTNVPKTMKKVENQKGVISTDICELRSDSSYGDRETNDDFKRQFAEHTCGASTMFGSWAW